MKQASVSSSQACVYLVSGKCLLCIDVHFCPVLQKSCVRNRSDKSCATPMLYYVFQTVLYYCKKAAKRTPPRLRPAASFVEHSSRPRRPESWPTALYAVGMAGTTFPTAQKGGEADANLAPPRRCLVEPFSRSQWQGRRLPPCPRPACHGDSRN